MDTPWIILAVVLLIAFAVLEAYSFKHPERENTLSHAIAELGAKWPMSIALYGLVMGILMAHFFWPWCANPLGAGVG